MTSRTVPAESFCQTLQANVDNERMDAETFREFVRNTLPIVQYEELLSELDEIRQLMQRMDDLIASDYDWARKYSSVFSDTLSGRLFELMPDLSSNYYDPDTTYEADVRAFQSAVHETYRTMVFCSE